MSWFVVENIEVCFFCHKSSDAIKTIQYRRKNVNWCRNCSFTVYNDYITECHFCYSDMYTEDEISPTAIISNCGEYCTDTNITNEYIKIGRKIMHENQLLFWCASTKCDLPHCKVKTCKWCKPGDSHICRKCGIIDSDHFTKDCPN